MTALTEATPAIRQEHIASLLLNGSANVGVQTLLLSRAIFLGNPLQPSASGSLSHFATLNLVRFLHLVSADVRTFADASRHPWITEFRLGSSVEVSEDAADLAISEFARNVSAIPLVVAVTHSIDRNVHRIWTFVRERDKPVRSAIYREEFATATSHPHLRFDFNVIVVAPDQPVRFAPEREKVILYRGDRL